MADPITWYALGRTVDDVESIMEAIDAKILTHNLDPSAHGQSGEVVFEHRSQTLLDHLFGSVDMKHLVDNKLVYFSGFESLDGWSTGGTVSVKVWGTILTTPASVDGEAYIGQDGVTSASETDFTKNPFFQTSVQLGSSTSQRVWLIRGGLPGNEEGDFFGFKILNGTLYAYWSSGLTEYTSEISGITVTDLHVYRAYCDSTAEKIYFYVDGVLEYTAETNYPTDGSARIFYAYITTAISTARVLKIIDLLIEQDR